jgi:hypothetical protein
MELIKRNLIYICSHWMYIGPHHGYSFAEFMAREESLVVVQDREAADTASTICFGQAIPAAAE